MASAQKTNKTHGIVTQTWQKDMKSIAKRQTTLDPQTSKGQGRHVKKNPPGGIIITDAQLIGLCPVGGATIN